ncbi:MAG: radical SAM protein [Anaerolineae bacterium]
MTEAGVVSRALAAVPLSPTLPLYRWDGPGRAMLYAPGCLALATDRAARHVQDLLQGVAVGATGSAPAAAARQLRQSAERAVAVAAEQAHERYRPLCLTLYLNQGCHLACTYCYAAAGPDGTTLCLSLDEIDAAAALVAANCGKAGRPFTVVFHGGGEPTEDGELLQQAFALVRRHADAAGCGLFTYIATNGCISAKQARWLAENIDLVGLSCDGPPDIQDRQRPAADGGPSSAFVERTARILHRAGRPFHVRSTVTTATMARQGEIAGYVGTVLRPAEMHFEPVYRGGRQESEVAADARAAAMAEAFVSGYLDALAVSERLGVPLHTSGVRLGAVHGPFCQVSRQVLNVVPGMKGCAATGCFRQSTAESARAAGLDVGGIGAGGGFRIDEPRVAALRRALGPPSQCASCFNRFHCAGDCPDRCRLEPPAAERGFRCLAQGALAYALIRRRAEALASTHAADLRRDGVCVATDLA